MKKHSGSTNSAGAIMVVGIAAVAVAFYAGYSLRSPKTGSSIDRQTMLSAIGAASSDTYAFPKSNLEWLAVHMGMMPKSFLKQSLISITMYGKVSEITSNAGTLPVEYSYYYSGSPKTYDFERSITLTDNSGVSKTVYFSAKQAQVTNVVKIANGRQTIAAFTDISPGDVVEIEETVDLAQSNINDENVLGLTLRILQ